MQRKPVVPGRASRQRGRRPWRGAQLALSLGSWRARFLLSIHVSARSSLRELPSPAPSNPPRGFMFPKIVSYAFTVGDFLAVCPGEEQEHGSHTDCERGRPMNRARRPQ